jgi:lysyl-tRNA synthetase class 1
VTPAPSSTSPEAPEGPTLWADRLAAEVLEHRTAADGPIVCASGISPSGPIHMGNLREVLTTHLVVQALRARGVDAIHLHSWDDYDRLRKVPAGVDPSFSEHVGRPLAAVPDPYGDLPSWADRFILEFDEALARLGVVISGRRQSELYPAGTYNAQIRRAMDQRALIFDTLAAQQTPGRQAEPVEVRRAAYSPFVVFCTVCGRDTTKVTAYADPVATWTCKCGHEGTMDLSDGLPISGKLVWKVDWPMRWQHEGVAFEPAGEDHHAPTGSFTVGRELVASLYGGTAPHSAVYSFVTLSGQGGKMSGSTGKVAMPKDALVSLEPAILRWLYVRRLPNQSFALDLSPKGVQKLYDEWDRLLDAAEADPSSVEARIAASSVHGSDGDVPVTRLRVPFRLLASVADITQGNREQLARIVGQHLPDAPASGEELLAELEPRAGCAIRLASEVVPPEERTVLRDAFAEDVWDSRDAATREGLRLLVAGLREDWSLDGLTALVYRVPKLMLGLGPDDAPTPEVKAAQRAFFTSVYLLLTGRETGPRLPTFLLSIGADRAEELLVGTPATVR